MHMKKQVLNIVTLGCSKNKVDSEHLAALLNNTYKIVHDSDEKSDVVIINTCGFIGDAKEESIDTILEYAELRKANKIKKLYVMGCLSERYKKELSAEIHEVDAFFGVEPVQHVAADIMKSDYHAEYCCERVLSTPSHYAYLKISEGCNRHCAFCAIPLIRGDHKSVPMENLVKEAENLAKKGVKELILIAQDLTYYGYDIDGKSHIVELVQKLTEIDGIEWIRLHYGYPLGFPVELLELMRDNPKICHYIDLPLQHVSTPILKAMRRGVDHEQTVEFVKKVRSYVPDIAFRSTFIVGFPGETEEQFNELIDFIKEMRFERAGVFAYSAEEGTPAYELEDDVPEDVKKARVDKFMDVQQDISLEINQKRLGRTEKVLIDRTEGGYYVGRTQYDSPEVDDEVLISMKDNKIIIGSFVNVKITQADYFDCYGEVISH
ncbi:MAG: 30S ribosomal protein S12 methylthiotransferase RimO [Bacteroidetes bacterium]|nr:30S ribosomal protein S12 methylthiotransferase RimO [Bacteroidota bacterium]